MVLRITVAGVPSTLKESYAHSVIIRPNAIPVLELGNRQYCPGYVVS